MIFFIVAKNALGTRTPQVLRPLIDAAAIAPRGGWNHRGVQLIAWNEIYAEMADLLSDLLVTADADPVCQLMAASARQLTGLDPMDDSEDQWLTLMHWAHPMVGNIVGSPSLRPTDLEDQMDVNWDRMDGVDSVTRASIWALRRTMVKLLGAPRDQVRVAHNLTELARAFVGELTTRLTRKVEKLLALRLCSSEQLLAAQRSLVTRLLKVRGDALRAAAVEHGFGHWEYTRYYLPNAGRVASQEARDALFTGLVAGALAPLTPVGSKDPIVRECLGQWIVLPPVICCAILVNDFRKFDRVKTPIFDRARPHCGPVATTVAQAGLTGQPIDKGTARRLLQETCEVRRDKGAKDHVPALPKLLWSWNREEYELPVITYRLHLCPQWGGSSGHTTGALAYWLGVLGTAKVLAPEDGCTVATSLFVLWRLYYDKRISAMHCMVETLEATLTDPVVGSEKGITLSPVVVGDEFDDPWSLLVAHAITGAPIAGTSQRLFGVNPIGIMHAALQWIGGGARGKALARRLEEELTRERARLAASFFLPEWSRETTGATGTAVRAHGHGTIRTLGA
jgi:hypothetical protein